MQIILKTSIVFDSFVMTKCNFFLDRFFAVFFLFWASVKGFKCCSWKKKVKTCFFQTNLLQEATFLKKSNFFNILIWLVFLFLSETNFWLWNFEKFFQNYCTIVLNLAICLTIEPPTKHRSSELILSLF